MEHKAKGDDLNPGLEAEHPDEVGLRLFLFKQEKGLLLDRKKDNGIYIHAKHLLSTLKYIYFFQTMCVCVSNLSCVCACACVCVSNVSCVCVCVCVCVFVCV